MALERVGEDDRRDVQSVVSTSICVVPRSDDGLISMITLPIFYKEQK